MTKTSEPFTSPSDHQLKLGLWDDLMAMYVPAFYESIRDLPEDDRLRLAMFCGQVIAQDADSFMFPAGSTPRRFSLHPPIGRDYTFGQVMAIGLLCVWTTAPENAEAGAYGPAEMFPRAAAAFRRCLMDPAAPLT